MQTTDRRILVPCLALAVLVLSEGCRETDNARLPQAKPVQLATRLVSDNPQNSKELLEQRRELDQTVWADEVEAQKYEAVFVRLWDQERKINAKQKFDVLANFPFTGELSLGPAGPVEKLEDGINLTKFQSGPTGQTFNPSQWQAFVQSIQAAGILIAQTEWHHSRFVPATDSTGPKSTISFTIHAVRGKTETTYAVKGDLEVQWSRKEASSDSSEPVADSIAVTGLTLQERSDGGLFEKLFTAKPEQDQIASNYPVLVYDLDGDGRSEIVLPRWNRVYWNKGKRKFVPAKFLEQPRPIFETGILSDFNGDGNVDFVTVGKDGKPCFYAGTEEGKFPAAGEVCAAAHFDFPTVITAGDADGDGDLDLWIAQYKFSFIDGQMPTPFYDANDGHPSYFLKNDGSGSFTDVTKSAGLSPLRNRRTYSASFIDLDDDGDLDLLNVSDYAGLDIYRNSGNGVFELATESFVKERNFFGMGHTFGDYNEDGLLDFYVIGMSSTTARRLDRLKLGREDRPDVHPMRAAMGYGNRLYLGNGDGTYREDPGIAAAVARTGWSWGATSSDFDLDGDQDIYVANGHRSGKSCQDYCTTFWTHDIYTGTSKGSPEIFKVFKSTLKDINRQAISWNGYEKNVLFVNQKTKPERFLNSSFMFGAAWSYDARSVVSDDLDADGWPDLVLAETTFLQRGVASAIHVYANNIKTGRANNWLTVQLRESNQPGYSPNGAKVTITDSLGQTQTRWIVSGDSFLAQHAPVAHFGIGKAKSVTSIEVTWPGGKTEKRDAEAAVKKTVVFRGGTVNQ